MTTKSKLGGLREYDALVHEVLSSPDARCAYMENDLRRRLADALDKHIVRTQKTPRALAKEMHISVAQMQRLLHREAGGALTLRTICHAADALGLSVLLELN